MSSTPGMPPTSAAAAFHQVGDQLAADCLSDFHNSLTQAQQDLERDQQRLTEVQAVVRDRTMQTESMLQEYHQIVAWMQSVLAETARVQQAITLKTAEKSDALEAIQQQRKPRWELQQRVTETHRIGDENQRTFIATTLQAQRRALQVLQGNEGHTMKLRLAAKEAVRTEWVQRIAEAKLKHDALQQQLASIQALQQQQHAAVAPAHANPDPQQDLHRAEAERDALLQQQQHQRTQLTDAANALIARRDALRKHLQETTAAVEAGDAEFRSYSVEQARLVDTLGTHGCKLCGRPLVASMEAGSD